MAAILFSSAIGPVPIDCVISENHTSELDITEIPVENGSKITDHAVRAPKRLSLEVATAGAAVSFNALKQFQESRVPFSIVTGLTVYNNMLIKSMLFQRDATYSTILKGTVGLQEVIIVATSYAADPAGDNAQRGQAGGKKSTRAAAPSANRSPAGPQADRASGTLQRGDAGSRTPTAKDQSILKQLLN